MKNLDFDALLEPFSSSEFYQKHWEHAYLLVKRNAPKYYHGLLTLNSVDDLLVSLREPEFSLAKNGKVLSRDVVLRNQYWKDELIKTIDLDRFYKEFMGGATLILETLHRKHPPIACLCRTLEKQFYTPVQANAYLTPPKSQGFSAHYDTHDVFVLQIEGKKHWRLHRSPITLPTRKQKHSSAMGAMDSCFVEFDLCPGDCLYLPRGLGHEASASESMSLHITIGVLSYTLADLIGDVANELALQDPKFRAGAFSRDQDGLIARDVLIKRFQELLPRIGESIASFEQIDRLLSKKSLDRDFVLPGRLGGISNSELLNSDSMLEICPDVTFAFSLVDDLIIVTFNNKRIKLPEQVAPELCFIGSQTGPFVLSSIEGVLCGEDKMRLIRELIIEGFLRIVKR